MITDRLDREKEWVRREDWCGQKDPRYHYQETPGFVRRMKLEIYLARGKWSMPYKGYFENGHTKGIIGSIRTGVST
jgi:hypothetical protein